MYVCMYVYMYVCEYSAPFHELTGRKLVVTAH